MNVSNTAKKQTKLPEKLSRNKKFSADARFNPNNIIIIFFLVFICIDKTLNIIPITPKVCATAKLYIFKLTSYN